MTQSFLQIADSRQFSRFGQVYVVIATITWALLYLLQFDPVPNLAFATMVGAGVAFMVLPRFGYSRLGVQLGLCGTWLAVFFLALNPLLGKGIVVGGFTIVALMVMVFGQGRMWIVTILLSTITIVALHLASLSSTNSTVDIALMVAQLAQFLGASFLFWLVFKRFQEMLQHEVVTNEQLSQQRTQLEKHSAELQWVNIKLKEKTTLLELITQTVPARITYMDADGTVLFSNYFEEQIGTKDLSILGCPHFQSLTNASASVLVHNEKRAFAGMAGDFEVRRLATDGDEVIEMVSYVPQSEQGELVGILTLVTNVTESHNLAEMFRQSQKLESLGTLAGGVAHDFNNLLVSVLGQNSVALARLEESHPARKHVQRSVNAAERASILTKQMLAYSGKGSFSIKVIDINALIQSNLELLAVTLPAGVELEVKLAESLPSIEADEAQIQQVLMNLIINAGQAIGAGNGQVRVETEIVSLSAEADAFWKITGKPIEPGEYVSIRIIDNGCGIPQDVADRIFDPFFTTKTNGNGLGLAAVIGIIRGHNGGIKLTTAPEQGTEFHLLFPIASTMQTMEITVESHFQSPHTSGNPATVLVIDDEADVIEVVSDMLALKGIEVLTAENGATGLTQFKQHRQRISLVLLDLMMPGMSGDETFQALRDIDPTVRVILSSGYSEAEASRHFVGNQLAAFIQKPYELDHLINKINDVLSTELSIVAA